MPGLIGIPGGPDRGLRPVEIVMQFRIVAIATPQVQNVPGRSCVTFVKP